ncbi:hypothetical protein FACS18942_06130 [Planctomycetales bacterium]|nr:hypothetical protein FACS18942_06130 [Planctomycetales bacterium]
MRKRTFFCGTVALWVTTGILLCASFTGCQSGLFTVLYLLKGNEVKPKYEILLKGEKRVAVVCKCLATNYSDIQNAPREIAHQVSGSLDKNVQNKKLKIVDTEKIDAWLDDCNNDFDSFVEVGKAKGIDADIVIGIEILGFQLRDPKSHYLLQGKCQAVVRAYDCKTGECLVTERLSVVDPPNTPISAGSAGVELAFRPQFITVVSQQIAVLFHQHDPNRSRRIDADNLQMQTMN